MSIVLTKNNGHLLALPLSVKREGSYFTSQIQKIDFVSEEHYSAARSKTVADFVYEIHMLLESPDSRFVHVSGNVSENGMRTNPSYVAVLLEHLRRI